MPMLHAAGALGAAPHEVVAIGDSVNDALAARAAGMAVFAVPYGYNEGRDVRSMDTDGIVGSLLEAAHRIDRSAEPRARHATEPFAHHASPERVRLRQDLAVLPVAAPD